MFMKSIDLLHKIIRWEYRKKLLGRKLVPNVEKIKRVEDVPLDLYVENEIETLVNWLSEGITEQLDQFVDEIEEKRKFGLAADEIPEKDSFYIPDEFDKSEARQIYKNKIIKMAEKLIDDQNKFHTKVSPDILEKYKKYEKIPDKNPRTNEDIDKERYSPSGHTQKQFIPKPRLKVI